MWLYEKRNGESFSETYLELSRISKIKLFCEIGKRLKAVGCFRKLASM